MVFVFSCLFAAALMFALRSALGEADMRLRRRELERWNLSMDRARRMRWSRNGEIEVTRWER